MGRSATDPNGTAALAAQRGVSRRTIQRERAKLLRTTEAAQAQAVPTQLSLTGIGPPAMIWPEELRVDPIAAAARAGAIEEAVAIRTRQALERGDAPAVKCFTSAWQDVVKCLSVLEELARERIRELPERIQQRREISGNLDDLLVSHGPAWIRANMPSQSEIEDGFTDPMSDEEYERAIKAQDAKSIPAQASIHHSG